MVATSDKKEKRRTKNNEALQQRINLKKDVAFSFDERKPTTTTTSLSSPTSTAQVIAQDCLANLAARKILEKLQKDSALFDEVPDIPRLSSADVEIFSPKILGEGGFGVVKEGELKSTQTKVAVKQVRPILATTHPTVYANGAADLVTEGEILGRLSHPNIIKLHGVSERLEFSHPDNNDTSFIVLEPLQDTLGTKLVEWYEQMAPITKNGKRQLVPLKEQLQLLKVRLQVALQIAKAIQYLHSKKILYRDLKNENVGFTADGTVKLFDFGLAKEIKKSQQEKEKFKLTGNTGSRRYMAPEVAKGWAYNDRVDVYSFGILLWELSACQRAFPQYTPEEFSRRVHQAEERPALVDWWPVELQWLLKKSWGFFANSRPDMDVVVETLEEVLEDIDEELGRNRVAHGGGASLRRFIRHTTETFRLSKEGRPPKPASYRPTSTVPTAQPRNHSNLPPRPKAAGAVGHRRGGSGSGAGLFGFGLFAKHHAAQQKQEEAKPKIDDDDEKPNKDDDDDSDILSDAASNSSTEYDS